MQLVITKQAFDEAVESAVSAAKKGVYQAFRDCLLSREFTRQHGQAGTYPATSPFVVYLFEISTKSVKSGLWHDGKDLVHAFDEAVSLAVHFPEMNPLPPRIDFPVTVNLSEPVPCN